MHSVQKMTCHFPPSRKLVQTALNYPPHTFVKLGWVFDNMQHKKQNKYRICVHVAQTLSEINPFNGFRC